MHTNAWCHILDKKDARIAELERKLAEQQAIVANFFSLYGVDVTGRGLDELNALLAKAKEEGRREPVPEGTRVLSTRDSYCPACGHDRDTSSVSTIDCGESISQCQMCGTKWKEAMLAAAPKPEGVAE